MLGVPGGMQNAIFAIANLFVQTGVNSFDAVMVSGNSAAINADTLIFNIMTAFYTACASFMGQNMGAGNRERMIKSYRISLLYSFLAGAILVGCWWFRKTVPVSFASKPEVIEAGMERIKIMGFPMHFPHLWTARLRHPAELERALCRPLLLSWAPAYSV